MTNRNRLDLSNDEKATLYDFLLEVAPGAVHAIARRYAAACFDGSTEEVILAAYAAHHRGELPTSTES